MASQVLNVGDILRGTIVRIEAYGAFCRLEGPIRSQGLIHISQLAGDQRVERVEDVVAVDDQVWVKVLNVEMDPKTQRWRIQLSLKDVSQDGMATDLGLERETRENQRNQLESNLNSMIGMGVARDPMADRLIMKNDRTRGSTTFWGGYSLVGDDEGESQPEPIEERSTTILAPLGRGRGTTLPAWMTQVANGPTGENRDEERHHSNNKNDKKKVKKEKKKDPKSHRKRDRKVSSRERKREGRRKEDDECSFSKSEEESTTPSQCKRRKRGDEKVPVSSRKDKINDPIRSPDMVSRSKRRRHYDNDRSCDSSDEWKKRRRSYS